MGLDRPIDITADQRKTLLALLERYLPNTAAWVYGSRVKWTSRPQSDLDLVVFATPDQQRRVSELREAFEESNLPFRVDLFVWDDVPEQFRKQIEADHVVLVERQEQGATDGWQEIPFAQLLAEPLRNGIYKKKEFHGRGVKIINMGELFAHPRLRAVPMKRVELSESEVDRFLITAGDLLFARRSLVAEGAGKCCVVLNVVEPTTFESSIIRARPDNTKADYLYLYYFFNSALGLYHLDTIRRQVAVAGITGSDLAKLEIPLPPLPDQRAVAHILGNAGRQDRVEPAHERDPGGHGPGLVQVLVREFRPRPRQGRPQAPRRCGRMIGPSNAPAPTLTTWTKRSPPCSRIVSWTPSWARSRRGGGLAQSANSRKGFRMGELQNDPNRRIGSAEKFHG